MIGRRQPFYLVVFCLALTNSPFVSAEPVSRAAKIISVQYLVPGNEDRDIDTTNIDFNYFITEVEKARFRFFVSVTASYATGTIIQLEGSLASGTLHEVRHENSAIGVGPGFLANFRPWYNNKYSIHINASGSLIIYNKEFPFGGERYNFMWRGGPAFEYALDKSRAIGLGYEWAHISNGQGVGQENPSYDASGFIVRLTGYF